MPEVQELESALNLDVMPLYPFQRPATCPKCGWRIGWLMRPREPTSSGQRVQYCKGNLDSTQEVHDIFGRPHEAKNPCTGVFEEHLHLLCGLCSYHWLMATKKGK